MPTVTQLEQQGQALFLEQKALVDDETRPWSEKRDEFDRREADIKAVVEQRNALKSIDGNPFEKLGDDKPVEPQQATRKGIAQQFVESPQYEALAAAKGQRITTTADLKTAATITQATTGAGTVQPQYLPGTTPLLFRRLTVADLLPQGAMNGPTIIYRQMTAVTNNAATVAEGAPKPLSDATWVQVTENARKIATTAKLSDEMVADADYVQSEVSQLLVELVELAEEDQLLNGDGTAPNLRGLMNRSGLTSAQAVGSDTQVDALFKEITKIRSGSFLNPDGIVLNPADWQTIRLSKDGNEQYYGGGPFSYGPYGVGGFAPGGETTAITGGNESLWGVRVVVTPAIAAGTALVGSFGRAAMIFRRSGITIEATNANEDDFLHNLIALRCEERLALQVKYPAGFGKVTGL